MNTFLEIRDKIFSEDNIVVISHVNPDGDAIGSGLALTLGLKKIGKNVRFILQDKYPDSVKFLNEINIVEQYNENNEYKFDLAICVDGATDDRLGKAKELLKNRFVINIDHHISNTLYGKLNYVEEISSTSELIYKFLKFCEIDIDINMAEEKTFEMAAELKRIGASNSKVVREFFNTKSLPAIKLLGIAMYEMEYNENKKLAYYFMSKETLDKYNGRKEDTEGIVEKLISFKEAEVSLFLREDKIGVIKGSMRSKHDIDVNEIASIFGGGGHRKAAGFTSELLAEEIIKKVLERL